MCETVTVNLRTIQPVWRWQVKMETILLQQSMLSYTLMGRPACKICSNDFFEEVKIIPVTLPIIIFQFLICAFRVVCKTTQCLHENALYLVSQNQEHCARSPHAGISDKISCYYYSRGKKKKIILEGSALVWQYHRDTWDLWTVIIYKVVSQQIRIRLE